MPPLVQPSEISGGCLAAQFEGKLAIGSNDSFIDSLVPSRDKVRRTFPVTPRPYYLVHREVQGVIG